MTLSGEERQHSIWQTVQHDGRVSVVDLASQFDVTSETIRRDLSALESAGLVRRVHGGAVPADRLIFEPGLEERAHQMTEEKIRIAEAALDLLPDQGAIFLDAGSTTAQLADRVPATSTLTIATNSLPIASNLAQLPGVTVLITGGRIRGRTQAAVDDWALRSLRSIRVEIAFVAANAVSPEHGLGTPDASEAAVKRAIVEAGERIVLLADHTKFETKSLLSYASMSEVDVAITGNEIDKTVADQITSQGVELVRV